MAAYVASWIGPRKTSLGPGHLDIGHRQPAQERRDHQRFQHVVLGDVLTEQARDERSVVPRSIGRSSCLSVFQRSRSFRSSLDAYERAD